MRAQSAWFILRRACAAQRRDHPWRLTKTLRRAEQKLWRRRLAGIENARASDRPRRSLSIRSLKVTQQSMSSNHSAENRYSAKSAGLLYVAGAGPGIQRIAIGKGWRYLRPG